MPSDVRGLRPLQPAQRARFASCAPRRCSWLPLSRGARTPAVLACASGALTSPLPQEAEGLTSEGTRDPLWTRVLPPLRSSLTALAEALPQLPAATYQAPTLSIQPRCVAIEEQHCRFSLRSDGTFQLLQRSKQAGLPDKLGAAGRLPLPPDAGAFAVASQVQHGDSRVEAVVVWGEAAQPAARLRILSPPLAEHSWCKGLDHGYLLEFSVSAELADTAEVQIDMHSAGHWFGGGHLMRQLWPLERACLEVGPYYPFDNGPNGLNTLVGPQWMTSKGLLVMVDPDTPFLHVGMNAPAARPGDGWVARSWGVGVQNMSREYLPLAAAGLPGRDRGDGLLRLQARASYQDRAVNHPLRDWAPSAGSHGDAPTTSSGGGMLTVKVALCAVRDAREACRMALATLTPPGRAPAAEVLTAPIWTTWARHGARVTQAKVLAYAREIAARGMQRSVMEIDDRWQRAYGDLEFDAAKFPDPRAMVDQLHALGFKVTVWVMPFVEERSNAYKEGAAKGYFIRGGTHGWGVKPGFFRWWQLQPVCALDLTNPEAVNWFKRRLRALQEATGVDGFKFDAGEPCFLPRNFTTHAPISHPTEYTRLWVEQVAASFRDSGICEVRTGHRTQHVGLLTRMGDRFSTWDLSNGLQSIIPTLLTSGLLGYPFCLPDMVGGNAYFGQRPDKELLVRWTQASALMPALQFSIAPWDLCADTAALCASALQLRQKLVGTLLGLAGEAAAVLSPIARPMWWLDPADPATFAIADQFALGDNVIVAPVVERGARARDVYLTAGRWRDLAPPYQVWEGGQWLRGLDAPLSRLPAFERVIDVDPATTA